MMNSEHLELLMFLTGREYCDTAKREVEAGRGTPETVFIPLFLHYEKLNILDRVRQITLATVGEKPLPQHTLAEYELVSALMWHFLVENSPFPQMKDLH